MQENRQKAPVVVVTGSSAGVGRATALAFARRGWAVALLARGPERLQSAAREVERAGGRALALATDVADAAAVERAADQVAASFGGIDVWINNAMATVYAPVAQISAEEVKRVTEVTYLGQVHGTMAALRHMQPRGEGTIVQIGSALAYRSIPLQSAYCAAKAAVRGFTDSLRSELLHNGSRIRLTMVQLPAVDTPQFDWARSHLSSKLQPVPPIHAPEAVAEEIVRAAMETPRELWVGGPALQAIVGTMVAPGLLDWMMARQAWPGQMTGEPAAPRPDNLFEAPPGDPGARGRFGDRSRPEVFSVSGTAVRAGIAMAAIAAGTGLAALGFALGAQRGSSRQDSRPSRTQRIGARRSR